MAYNNKYQQNRKDREDESIGMKEYHRKYKSKDAYRMDSQYFHMLSEDRNAPANLPQHVVHELYPKCDYMDAYELDDTIRGLDDTRNEDIEKAERYQSDTKY